MPNRKEKVDALYANGRNTVMGDYELDNILRECDERAYEYFQIARSDDARMNELWRKPYKKAVSAFCFLDFCFRSGFAAE